MVRELGRAKSSSRAVVEVEQTTDPLASPNAPCARVGVRNNWLDQPITQSLVIPFHVVMINVRHDRLTKMPLTKRNDSR